jgi:hypothetical protein
LEALDPPQKTQCELAIRAITILRQKLKEIDINDYRDLPLKFKVK